MTVVGFFGARYWQRHGALACFGVQLLVFTIFTGLMLAGGVVPISPRRSSWSSLRASVHRRARSVLQWLNAAQLAIVLARVRRAGATAARHEVSSGPVGRAVYLRRPLQSSPMFSSMKGLLATSGALAVIIGLAPSETFFELFFIERRA